MDFPDKTMRQLDALIASHERQLKSLHALREAMKGLAASDDSAATIKAIDALKEVAAARAGVES
jgi:hypothetical protein